jgi:hypothetical protein
LRDKVEAQDKELMAHAKEISELRGNIRQMDKVVNAVHHQSVWQLIVLIITICGSVIGALTYQTHMIDKRLEHLERRIELSEKNLNIRIDAVEKRIEITEKNLNARFENLKQEVRAQRK